MAVCLAFSRAPADQALIGAIARRGHAIHRLSNPTELLDHRFRKPNPVRVATEPGVVPAESGTRGPAGGTRSRGNVVSRAEGLPKPLESDWPVLKDH